MTKISFQGEHGAYSESAAKKFFGKEINAIPCNSFEDALKITENGENEYVAIYPNPANDQAWFYQAHSTNNPYSLQLFSSEGKLVDELVGQTDHLQLDLSKYNAGVYFYRYINETTNVINVGKFLRLK